MIYQLLLIFSLLLNSHSRANDSRPRSDIEVYEEIDRLDTAIEFYDEIKTLDTAIEFYDEGCDDEESNEDEEPYIELSEKERLKRLHYYANQAYCKLNENKRKTSVARNIAYQHYNQVSNPFLYKSNPTKVECKQKYAIEELKKSMVERIEKVSTEQEPYQKRLDRLIFLEQKGWAAIDLLEQHKGKVEEKYKARLKEQLSDYKRIYNELSMKDPFNFLIEKINPLEEKLAKIYEEHSQACARYISLMLEEKN